MNKGNGRYEEGRINRQKILDYLNAHPGSTAVDVRDALGFQDSTCATILKRMTFSFGELTRESFQFRTSKNVNVTTFRYWAQVEKTISASEVAKRVYQNLVQKDSIEKENGFRTNAQGTKKKNEPWRYVNDPSDRPAPKSIDNIGSGGLAFGIQSSFQMI